MIMASKTSTKSPPRLAPTADEKADRASSRETLLVSPAEDSSFLPSALASPLGLRPPDADQDESSAKLGTFSAINIILGKTIGVAIYSIPASVYSDVGSVGMALLAWLVGAAISFCGLSVYLDLGTALPRSGGEKVYLERVFRRPGMLATCMLMSYVVLLGFSTPNCIVLGEYLMYALGVDANRWNVRGVAVLAVTAACVIHARSPRLGLRLINVLGVIKMMIIAMIIVGGFASVSAGLGRSVSFSSSRQGMGSTTFTRNFNSLFQGTTTQPYAIASAVIKTLYCFRGYNTANQVMSDIRRPVRTLSLAAPIALGIVSAAYLLVNVAYFCAVEKSDLAASGLVVAGRFFANVFGPVLGAHLLPCLVVLSAFGSVVATSFAQARVNHEFARDGVLPFSSFWASSSPWGTPAPALLLHWIVSVAVIVLPPSGQIYAFLIELGGYPVSVISVAVAGGLLYLQLNRAEEWRSPMPASRIAVVLFLLCNVVLLILPWIPPAGGMGGAGIFPYFAYPATGLAVVGLGAVYWVWWALLRERWQTARYRIILGSVRSEDESLLDWRADLMRKASS